MKKYSCYSLIWIFLFANNVCGQTMFIKELAEAKKMTPSAKKDSIIVDLLYQLALFPTFETEKWKDSIKLFSITNKNHTAFLINSIYEAEFLNNIYNGKNGSNSLLKIATELENKKLYIYSSFAFLRLGAVYNYILTDKRDKIKALPHYNKALKLALLSKSEFAVARAYDYIGEYYLTINEYKNAIKYLKLAKKQKGNYQIQYLLPTIYTSLASCYISINNLKLAEEYNNKSNEILQDKKYEIHPRYQIYIKHMYLVKVTEYFYSKGSFEKSLKYGLQGLQMADIFTKAYGYRNDFRKF